MKLKYTLIHPHIEAGRGRAAELIGELAALYQEGRAEGSEEIAAIVSLLGSDDLIPNIAYVSPPGGPIDMLSRDFVAFMTEGANPADPFLRRYMEETGLEGLSVVAGGYASATGALTALLMSAGVRAGEVIATSLNYVGVVNSITLAGAVPKFVDVDSKTWCMDPESLKGAISKRTRAVLLTHLNRTADLEAIYDVLKEKGAGVPVIQDASLAIGSTTRGLRPGVINVGEGGATVFSLATSKPISGLGGAVAVCNDVEVLRNSTTIAYQGMNLASADILDARGGNFKMNDMNAVIAREQLMKREEIFARRRELAALYDELLSDAVEGGRIAKQDVGEEAVITHYGILVDGRRELAIRLMERHGVPLGMWHIHHRQKPYEEFGGNLPASDAMDDRVSFLPFHTKLSDDDVKYICKALLDEIGAG